MAVKNLQADNPVPDDLKFGIKAFGAICAKCSQPDLAAILGTVTNAVEQNALPDLALNIAIYAKRNGLDKPIDFSDLKGVNL